MLKCIVFNSLAIALWFPATVACAQVEAAESATSPSRLPIPVGYVLGQDGYLRSPLEQFVAGELNGACTQPELEVVPFDPDLLPKAAAVATADDASAIAAHCLGFTTQSSLLQGEPILCRMKCDTTPFQRVRSEGELFWCVRIHVDRTSSDVVPWMQVSPPLVDWEFTVSARDGTVLWLRSVAADLDKEWIGESGVPEVSEAGYRGRFITDAHARHYSAVTPDIVNTLFVSINKSVGSTVVKSTKQCVLQPVHENYQILNQDGKLVDSERDVIYIDLLGIHTDSKRHEWAPHQPEQPWFATNHMRVLATDAGSLIEHGNVPERFFNCEEWWSFHKRWVAGLDEYRKANPKDPARSRWITPTAQGEQQHK